MKIIYEVSICCNASDTMNIGAVDQKEENVLNHEYTITLEEDTNFLTQINYSCLWPTTQKYITSE